MRFFDGFLLNTILLLFPLFIYLIYVVHQKVCNKDIMNQIFDVSLFLSLFIMIRYGYINNYYISVLISIPLLFAYLKGRKLSSIVISIILIIFSIIEFKVNAIIIIFEYLTYYILYLIYNKKNISTIYIINGFTIVKTFMLSFITFASIFPMENILINMLNIFLSITMFYLESILYYKLIQKTEDIVALNNTIKELEKEKSIRNSLFKITHEIKNPIAVCKGYLDMIDINNKKKVEKYVPIIKSEINRTLSLLDDYLDYSKVKIEKDIIDIIMLLEDTLRSMGVLLKEKDIITNFNIIEEEVYIMADYNRLKQVFVNLIKNSMESKLEERELVIDIKTELTNNSIQIIISDNGIGMDKKELDRLGEAFYTTKSNGTGIGVNLSKEIIEKHNGTLTYKSEKYVGTDVIIELPIDPELNDY